MNSNDIESFIASNLPNFRINGKGWHDLIKKMLFEFCIAGWDQEIPVYGKEKFGGLRCYIAVDDEVLKRNIALIIQRYAQMAGCTCEQCGANGKERVINQWFSTLCKTCYWEKNKVTENLKHATFEPCKICGYIAADNGNCNYCNNDDYFNNTGLFKPQSFFENEIDYIKECQIEIFLDEEDDIALEKLRDRFKKAPNHQILFRLEDLNQYRELKRK